MPKLYENPPPFEDEREVTTIQKAATLSLSKHYKGRESYEQKRREEKAAAAAAAAAAADKAKEEESERDFEILQNPSRVTINQLPKINLSFSTHYEPITGEVFHGFVMLKEKQNNEEEDEE